MKLFIITIATLFLNLLLLSSAQACSCCGLDNTWGIYKSPLSDYTGSVLLGLNINNGTFDDAPAYVKDYDIKSVKKKAGKFIFLTKSGDIVFSYNNSIEHRMKDITFLTNKNYKYSDNADIYHELILKGKLILSAGILKKHQSDIPSYPLRKVMNATMIFQGFGNSCIEGPEFKKWLIKLDEDKVNFQGYGSIKPKVIKSR